MSVSKKGSVGYGAEAGSAKSIDKMFRLVYGGVRTRCTNSRPRDRNLKLKEVAMTKHLSFSFAHDNMHAVDTLASVREKIAELKKLEAELREHVLNSPDDRVGDAYQADVIVTSQNRISQEKIAELVGDLDLVRKPIETTVVRINKIGETR